MEPKSYWGRFNQFIKDSFTEKFKAFFPGVGMGFFGAKHLLWVGVPFSVVEYAIKGVGTIVLAFGSGLATSYAAYLIDRYKEKRNPISPLRDKKKKRA